MNLLPYFLFIKGVIAFLLSVIHHRHDKVIRSLSICPTITTLTWITLLVVLIVAYQTHVKYLTFRLAHNHTVVVQVIPLNEIKFCQNYESDIQLFSMSDFSRILDEEKSFERTTVIVVFFNGSFRKFEHAIF